MKCINLKNIFFNLFLAFLSFTFAILEPSQKRSRDTAEIATSDTTQLKKPTLSSHSSVSSSSGVFPDTADSALYCPYCPNTYGPSERTLLQEHIKMQHCTTTSLVGTSLSSNTVVEENSDEEFHCPYNCGKGPYTLKKYLYQHMSKFHPDKIYHCTAKPCRRWFIFEKELIEHIQTKHAISRSLSTPPSSTSTQICPHCSKSFAGLRQHINNCHEDKMYHCIETTCNRWFIYEKELIEHAQTKHAISRSPSTPSSTRQSSPLRLLGKDGSSSSDASTNPVPTVPKYYPCPSCSTWLLSQAELHDHISSVHSLTSSLSSLSSLSSTPAPTAPVPTYYPCPSCSMWFLSPQELTHHMNTTPHSVIGSSPEFLDTDSNVDQALCADANPLTATSSLLSLAATPSTPLPSPESSVDDTPEFSPVPQTPTSTPDNLSTPSASPVDSFFADDDDTSLSEATPTTSFSEAATLSSISCETSQSSSVPVVAEYGASKTSKEGAKSGSSSGISQHSSDAATSTTTALSLPVLTSLSQPSSTVLSFKCPHACGKICGTARILRTHIVKYHPDKIHRCTQCSHGFIYAQELTDHLKYHRKKNIKLTSSIQSLRCPYDNCTADYSLSNARANDILRQHIRRSHKKGSYYPCTVITCQERFLIISTLMDHLKTHTSSSTLSSGENPVTEPPQHEQDVRRDL